MPYVYCVYRVPYSSSYTLDHTDQLENSVELALGHQLVKVSFQGLSWP